MIPKVINFLVKDNPLLRLIRSGPSGIKKLPKTIKQFFYVWIWHTSSFIFLLVFYLFQLTINKLLSLRIFPSFLGKGFHALTRKVFNYTAYRAQLHSHTIDRFNLIDLALRNMMFKKSRAAITVGGMAIGVGAIVFLVSIGFGLQELVVNRVARLDELKQTDISAQPGGKEKINDETLAHIKDIKDVKLALPQIASVARVTFQNSVSDMAVYGVTADYLLQSAVQPIEGQIFDSNDIAIVMPTDTEKRDQVAGLTTQDTEELVDADYKDSITSVNFTINPGVWIKVRTEPSTKGEIIGYTRRTTQLQSGTSVWGELFNGSDPTSTVTTVDGESLTPWIESDFQIWKRTTCSSDTDPFCEEDTYLPITSLSETNLPTRGYIAPIETVMSPTQYVQPQVLGIDTQTSTDSASLAGLTETPTSPVNDDSPWVDIASESATASQLKVNQVQLPSNAKRQAVVNLAMIKLLGLDQKSAVGKNFATSFVITGDLLEDDNAKIESYPTDYTIVGVIATGDVPFFYVPFVDLRSLGVNQYSQVKIVTAETENLAPIRKQIEAMGYSSRSVADTVEQISSLFSVVRTVLGILGLVALSVAALGMFNTLTVSLLERTREVGLMKAMGMKSYEVQQLFLTESMVMGVLGGVLGILFGFLAGKLLGLLLSVVSVSKGAGFIDIAYLPPSFVGFIFLITFIVGICTGIYPARRATKISALNALRYE